MKNISPFFLLLILVGVVTALASVIMQILKSKKDEDQEDISKIKEYPYQRADSLLSPAEKTFFKVLEEATEANMCIMVKVRLADIVNVEYCKEYKKWSVAFARIRSKHIDYVLCDRETFEIKYAIELDDKSHREEKRKDRDEFVNKVLEVAGIPVYHFPVKRQYTVSDIQRVLTPEKEKGLNSQWRLKE